MAQDANQAAQAAKQLKKLLKRQNEVGEKIARLNHQAARLCRLDRTIDFWSFGDREFIRMVAGELGLPDDTTFSALCREHGAAYGAAKSEQRTIGLEVTRLQKMAK
jgi:hypothetical protein